MIQNILIIYVALGAALATYGFLFYNPQVEVDGAKVNLTTNIWASILAFLYVTIGWLPLVVMVFIKVLRGAAN
jgi:hypothetical protein